MEDLVNSVDKYLLDLMYPKDCEICGGLISCNKDESPVFEGMCIVCDEADDLDEYDD